MQLMNLSSRYIKPIDRVLYVVNKLVENDIVFIFTPHIMSYVCISVYPENEQVLHKLTEEAYKIISDTE